MTKTGNTDKFQKVLRIGTLVLIDVCLICVAAICALWVRMDFSVTSVISQGYFDHWFSYSSLFVVLTVAVFIPLKLYTSLWEFAGVEELFHIIFAGVIVCVIQAILILVDVISLPRSFPLLNALLLICMVSMSRFSYRFLRDANKKNRSKSKQKRTMLIGAGSAGILVLREFQTSENSLNRIVCIVDDDKNKVGRYLKNVKICGTRKDIVRLVSEFSVEEIVYAIPAAPIKERKAILQICQQTDCTLKILPGVFQLANGEVSIQKIRDVDVLDLLGRDSAKVDNSQLSQLLSGKTVLVTGGGGSIGSELCRQIARFSPKRLIIFDIYENNAYDIQQELRRTIPDLNLVTLIGSVRDTARVEAVFADYHPEIVFHAAAHKHVPLMENSPNEAIKNNVFGTYHVAAAAAKYHTENFVLISTDKAVNPTNIMGASKRICEMIVQSMAKKGSTKFVAVRFGNVLGSNGSVIPLFKKQIEEGGPVTVTHPDIIRYFMTIPEAVSLVLQAGALAKQGEIFVLDMGEPVRIDDLARNLIRLSGFEPDVDIEVKYTGLRPGEKLFEEMLMDEEGLQTTENAMIHIGQPLKIDEDAFASQLRALERACDENAPNIKELVADIVKTYRVGANV